MHEDRRQKPRSTPERRARSGQPDPRRVELWAQALTLAVLLTILALSIVS